MAVRDTVKRSTAAAMRGRARVLCRVLPALQPHAGPSTDYPSPSIEQSELTGVDLVNGFRSGDDQRVEDILAPVTSMAEPKGGRLTARVDDHVGERIRDRRIMLGLTLQQLAEMIGVSYQQAHKYESGINRVYAGRLFEIARALSAPITYFYEGIEEEGPQQITLHQQMQIEIARNFAEIRNEKHQEAVCQLARALASR